MAISKSKGTLLQLSVATVQTTVAQCLDLTCPGYESKDFESMTLDQTGVGEGRDLTGYVGGADVAAELWWDPELAVQAALLALTTTPAKGTMKVVFVNPGASEFLFTVEGLKAKWSGNLDGIPSLTV